MAHRLAVLAVAAVLLVSACSSSSPASVSPAAPGVAEYQVTDLSEIVLDPSHLSLDFDVTNTGTAEGTPGCVITATSKTGVKSVGSALLSLVKIGDVDVAIDEKVTIRDKQAASVPLSGISVVCSSV